MKASASFIGVIESATIYLRSPCAASLSSGRRALVTRLVVRQAHHEWFSPQNKVGGRYVFNIGGNKYRLVAAIAWSVRVLWVKAVLTHAEYDKEGWK